MALCWTLDKLGPMCRTADDCGLVLEAMAGADPKDPTTVDEPFRYAPTPPGRRRRFRIGVLKNATARCQPEVEANFRKSLDVLRVFADLDMDVESPTTLRPAFGLSGRGRLRARSALPRGGRSSSAPWRPIAASR